MTPAEYFSLLKLLKSYILCSEINFLNSASEVDLDAICQLYLFISFTETLAFGLHSDCTTNLVPDCLHRTIDLQIVCAKVREGDKRIVRIKEGDPAGRHVVIVDDLVQSGGTLIECQVCKSMYISFLPC